MVGILCQLDICRKCWCWLFVSIFSQHFFSDFSSRCKDLGECQIAYLFPHSKTVSNSRLTWMKVGSWSWCEDIPHLLNCALAVQLLVVDRTSPQGAFTASVFHTIGETKTVSEFVTTMWWRCWNNGVFNWCRFSSTSIHRQAVLNWTLQWILRYIEGW